MMRFWITLFASLFLVAAAGCSSSSSSSSDTDAVEVATGDVLPGETTLDTITPTDRGPEGVTTPDVPPTDKGTDPGPTDPGTDPVMTDPGPTDPGTPDVPCVPTTACPAATATPAPCGMDSCGNSCGACATGYFCATPTAPATISTCVVSGCTTPTTWASTGVVASLSTPNAASATDLGYKAVCPNYANGGAFDGSGTNGLHSLDTTINPELTKNGVVAVTILMEFLNATFPVTAAENFQLVGLIGQPEAGVTPVCVPAVNTPCEYQVNAESFLGATSGTCPALISFPNASISATGALMAGPSTFNLDLNIAALGGGLDLVLQQALITGQITDGGVDATKGVLAGVLTQSELNATVATLTAACVTDPSMSLCSYLGTIKSFLPMLYDLNCQPDGTACTTTKPYNAMSVCFEFTLDAATITGMIPAATN